MRYTSAEDGRLRPVPEYFSQKSALATLARFTIEGREQARDRLALAHRRFLAAETLWQNGHSEDAHDLIQRALSEGHEVVDILREHQVEGDASELKDLLGLSTHQVSLFENLEGKSEPSYRELRRATTTLLGKLRDASSKKGTIRWRKVRRALGAFLLLAAIGTLSVHQGLKAHAYSQMPWSVEFYSGTALQGPATYMRAEKIAYRWGTDASPVGRDNFSMRARSCLRLAEPQAVRFTVGGDDGYRMRVNGERIISDWTTHPVTWSHETVELPAGVHYVTVEYYEAGAAAAVHVQLDGSAVNENLFRPNQDGTCDGAS